MKTWIPPTYVEPAAERIDLRDVTDWNIEISNNLGGFKGIYYVQNNYSPFITQDRFARSLVYYVNEDFKQDTPIELIVPTYHTRYKCALPNTTYWNTIQWVWKIRILRLEYVPSSKALVIKYIYEFLYTMSDSSLTQLTSEVGGFVGLFKGGTPVSTEVSTSLETHFINIGTSPISERTENGIPELTLVNQQEGRSPIHNRKSIKLRLLTLFRNKKSRE